MLNSLRNWLKSKKLGALFIQSSRLILFLPKSKVYMTVSGYNYAWDSSTKEDFRYAALRSTNNVNCLSSIYFSSKSSKIININTAITLSYAK